MIVLKILLWILLAVLGIILLVLVLPVKAEASFIGGELKYKLKYSLILLYSSDKKGLVAWIMKMRNKKKSKKKKDDPPEEQELFGEESDIITQQDTAPEDIPPVQEVEQVKPEAEPEPLPEPEEIYEEPEPYEEEAPKKKKKKKQKKNDEEAAEDEEATEEEEPNKKTLGEKIDFILDIWRAADRPVLKIFKGVKLSEIYIDFIIANEDAYKCAMNYGRISGTVYTLLGWFSVLFNVKLKTVDINPGFAVEKSRWDAAGKLSVRPITAVIAGIWFLITYIFKYFIPGKLQERKLKKAAARQK